MDIPINNPLLVGYFMMRNDGNDTWIQFKLKRLADFCYMCGLISHVTGCCSNKDPTVVTTPNGISAKLFGLWLRVESDDSMQYINTLEVDDRRSIKAVVDSAPEDLSILMHNRPVMREKQKC